MRQSHEVRSNANLCHCRRTCQRCGGLGMHGGSAHYPITIRDFLSTRACSRNRFRSRLLCEEADPLGVVHVHTVQHPRHIPLPRADSLASEHNVITCFVTNSSCRCSKHSIPCYHAGCIDCAQHWQQLTAGIRRVGRWLRNHHSPRQLLLR